MQNTILVTGATGTVGGEVVRQLAARGTSVRAGVRDISKAQEVSGPSVRTVEFDMGKPGTVANAIQGVEKMFLLTPVTENQVPMADSTLRMAVEAGVQHIVRLSVLGSDAEPGIQLGRWHREIETLVLNSGVDWTILRPNSFMQNLSTAVKSWGDVVTLPIGDGKVSYIDVRDVAAVAAEALTGSDHAGKTYELTGPEALSGSEAARFLSAASGRNITFEDISEDSAAEGLRGAGVPEWMVKALMELYGISKAGYAAGVQDTVEQVTGTPARSFEQFAGDYASLL